MERFLKGLHHVEGMKNDLLGLWRSFLHTSGDVHFKVIEELYCELEEHLERLGMRHKDVEWHDYVESRRFIHGNDFDDYF